MGNCSRFWKEAAGLIILLVTDFPHGFFNHVSDTSYVFQHSIQIIRNNNYKLDIIYYLCTFHSRISTSKVPRARCGPLARVHGVVAQVACFCPQKRMWSARDHRVLVLHGGCILKNSIDLCRALAVFKENRIFVSKLGINISVLETAI